MVRTMDGNARAFLSDRYRPLDNFDLATAVLPKLRDTFCEVKSSELTESRFYVQAVTDRVTAEVGRGDVVQAGMVISNSEVGLGSVKVEPLVFRLVCLNGMIVADSSIRKYHVDRRGQEFDLLDGAAEFYRDETRKLDDRSFFAKVQDVVEATLDQVKFGRIVERLQEAAERRIEGDPVKVVEVTAKRADLSEGEQRSVLRYLIEGGDLSQWGLTNAVTRTAEDAESYDRAVELERVGGRVIELSPTEWRTVGAAE